MIEEDKNKRDKRSKEIRARKKKIQKFHEDYPGAIVELNNGIMDDDESVGGWHETERMKKILNQRGPGWDEMGDDEDVGNAWTNGWLRHYCAGGPTPGKMAEWFRYCKMAAGAR